MAAGDIHPRIIKAMLAAIADLAIVADAGPPSVLLPAYYQILPDDTAGYDLDTERVVDIKFPAVLLTAEGEIEGRPGNDDTGFKSREYPVRVWIADLNPARNHARGLDYLTWRKRLMDAFDDQAIAAVPEVVRCTVQPNVIFDPRLPSYAHIVSGFVVRVETEEPR